MRVWWSSCIVCGALVFGLENGHLIELQRPALAAVPPLALAARPATTPTVRPSTSPTAPAATPRATASAPATPTETPTPTQTPTPTPTPCPACIGFDYDDTIDVNAAEDSPTCDYLRQLSAECQAQSTICLTTARVGGALKRAEERVEILEERCGVSGLIQMPGEGDCPSTGTIVDPRSMNTKARKMCGSCASSSSGGPSKMCDDYCGTHNHDGEKYCCNGSPDHRTRHFIPPDESCYPGGEIICIDPARDAGKWCGATVL